MKQEQYTIEQRQKMRVAKIDIEKMTYEMDGLHMFAPMKEVIESAVAEPVKVAWPAPRTYIPKVTKYNTNYTKPSSNHRENESPTSKMLRKSWKDTNAVSYLNGNKDTQIKKENKDLSHYTQKPDYILDDSVMFKTTSAMQNKDRNGTPVKGARDAFNMNRRGSPEYAASPQDNIKYAIGSNKDQVNLVL